MEERDDMDVGVKTREPTEAARMIAEILEQAGGDATAILFERDGPCIILPPKYSGLLGGEGAKDVAAPGFVIAACQIIAALSDETFTDALISKFAGETTDVSDLINPFLTDDDFVLALSSEKVSLCFPEPSEDRPVDLRAVFLTALASRMKSEPGFVGEMLDYARDRVESLKPADKETLQ